MQAVRHTNVNFAIIEAKAFSVFSTILVLIKLRPRKKVTFQFVIYKSERIH